MTEEEMVHASVQAVEELDQDPEGEKRAIDEMARTVSKFMRRYSSVPNHSINMPLYDLWAACRAASAAYAAFLPPVHVFVHEQEVSADATPS